MYLLAYSVYFLIFKYSIKVSCSIRQNNFLLIQ